jgi:hypothetical protein
MQIAEYLHDDPVFQAKNLTVWILHIELTVKERPRTTPMRAILKGKCKKQMFFYY